MLLTALVSGDGNFYLWHLPRTFLGAMSHFATFLAGLGQVLHGALGHYVVVLFAPVTLSKKESQKKV
jgi:hypothetical protein